VRKFLNTLFITTQGAYLHKEGEAIAIKNGDELLLRMPAHTIESLVCFGRVSLSPPLLGMCGEKRIQVAFLSENGEFEARVQGKVAGNVLLRRTQYRWADDASRSAGIAQNMVAAKVANARTVLLRAKREMTAPAVIMQEAIRRMAGIGDHLLRQGEPVETLRAMEGDAAKTYFSVFDEMIVQQKDGFRFGGRTRRPPRDAVNALLSFAYTLLMHDCTGALEGVGLDPCVGFLHADRPGRPSLALDLMEEFRPALADRLVLTLINRQQVKLSDFESREDGGVWMKPDARRTFLETWQKRKREEVVHPFLNEPAPVGLFPHIQALLLARHLRGDLDCYPATIWK
jgi:CRISPR-associated protein Cas1